MGVRSSLFADPRHGPLPAIFLLMTAVTGLVDAVSLLALGRVFVANMTGNVVFVGFALAGVPSISLPASLAALAGFLAGAAGGGRAGWYVRHRGRLLRDAALVELAMFAGALVVLLASTRDEPVRVTVAFLLAVAMGLQAATVRKLAVPDLNTNVLTMTLTGLVADPRPNGGLPVVIRRALGVAAMFGGAAVGAVLVLRVSTVATVAVGVGLMAAVAGSAALVSRRPAPWHDPPPGAVERPSDPDPGSGPVRPAGGGAPGGSRSSGG